MLFLEPDAIAFDAYNKTGNSGPITEDFVCRLIKRQMCIQLFVSQ